MASILKKSYKRLRFGKPIIIVSGLPRSGTSMAMKMLDAGGLEIVTDGIRTADEDNPKGYYEFERVKDLHQEEDRSWLADARGKAVKIISYLLKSLPPEHNYKVIFMRRNPKEIIMSQNEMLKRRGEPADTPDEKALEILHKDLNDALFFLRRPHFEVLELPYREALDHPREQAERIRDFLGLPMDVEKMAGVADRSLYRKRA